jgi:hypothetical protein
VIVHLVVKLSPPSFSSFIVAIMRLQNWLLSALSLSHITVGHGGLKLLGGFNAVSSLKPRSASLFGPRVNHMIQRRAENTHMELIHERTNNMRCGAVNGSCPAGYWYAQTAS